VVAREESVLEAGEHGFTFVELRRIELLTS
jgi:hypothetical protein